MSDTPRSPEVEAAEIKKYEAEAAFFEEKAGLTRVERWGAEKLKREQEASSDAARIFPFYGAVNKQSCYGCMDTLSQWYREDPSQPMAVVFNSPGGGVIDGLALFDHIKILQNDGATINTHSVGMAASMGGILLQVGEKRTISSNGYLLIHEISSGAIGNVSELEDELKFCQRLQERALDILTEKSNVGKTYIRRKWKRKDWWLDAEECLKHGFVDAIAE